MGSVELVAESRVSLLESSLGYAKSVSYADGVSRGNRSASIRQPTPRQHRRGTRGHVDNDKTISTALEGEAAG